MNKDRMLQLIDTMPAEDIVEVAIAAIVRVDETVQWREFVEQLETLSHDSHVPGELQAQLESIDEL